MMKSPHHRFPPSLCAVALSLFFLQSVRADEFTMSLAGKWGFQLDAENAGVDQKWFSRKLDDSVQLPGTTDENHKGILKDETPVDRLARTWYWKGPAWYQREVTISDAWKGKRVTLFLERTKNARVWVDGAFCGWDDTLSAPQIFDVSEPMTPGRHTITVLIDNSKLPPVGPAHAVDERTQTNWNGIVGRLELRATDPVWIDQVQVYPDAAKRQARVRLVIGNTTGQPASGKLAVGSKSCNVPKPEAFRNQTVEVSAPKPRNVVEFIYQPGPGVPLWDEFQPALLHLDLSLESKAGGVSFGDRQSVRFGMRDFTHQGNQFMVNGKPVFLRGRLDCANYPLTGYPPMDKAGWLRILGILKDWGLNHVRFHSWCPPDAAFEAADELGFYFQAELPNKRSAFNAPENLDAAVHNIDRLDVETTETNVSLFDYAWREGDLIMRHFGNHPAFTMFTLGNELGRTRGMFELVGHFQKTDPRHLYAQGSNNMHWNPSLAEGDDFWVAKSAAKDAKPIRGSFSVMDYPNPHIETRPPSTLVDYCKSIEGVPVPMIGHETGQFQVYPDFRDIARFTGVTRARNYEIFRERLKAAGMLDQDRDFVRASGALAAICYREDIETALRTPHMGGFQLLDIQDFPGQGTALVGMLNDFMEAKGIIEPVKWREFCCEVVPLVRMEKYTWTEDETFTGRVQVAQYGAADLPEAVIRVTLTDARGGKLASARLSPTTLKQGGLDDAGAYQLAFGSLGIRAPQRLNLTLAIEGTKYRNSYPLWVYPKALDNAPPTGVSICRSFSDPKTREILAKGGKVLLLPELSKLPRSVAGGFQTDFWSPMFSQSAIKRGAEPPPGTLGFLCDPKTPALAEFPTEFHSNWQWWQLVKHSRPINYDGTPDDYRPIVQVIDNFSRNHKLGLLAETKVGKGAMLICPIDLLEHQDQPEVRQFLHSLLAYVGSSSFAPRAEIEMSLLDKILP